jgi:hypothetical protein
MVKKKKKETPLRDHRGKVVYTHHFKKTDEGFEVSKKTVHGDVMSLDFAKAKKQAQKNKKSKEFINLNKKRKSLYNKKYRLLKKIEDYGIDSTTTKKFKKISSDINNVNQKIHKKSFSYLKLNQEKKYWQNRIKYLKKHYNEIDDKSKLSVIAEISSIQDIVGNISETMKEPILKKTMETRSKFIESEGSIEEQISVWEATDKIINILKTNDYKTITINGETYNANDFISIKWALDRLYYKITINTKRISRTPFVTIIINDTIKHITVDEAEY